MGFLSDILEHIDTKTDVWTAACTILGIILTYAAVLACYRLFISPLAQFPGPKLAALTYWTEAYYELLYGEGGQFVFKYREWHEKYGPIIRINPRELHIQDAPFFETFYASARPASKLKELEHRFNNPSSAFATSDHYLHRIRRGALNPFFSKRKISDRFPVIKSHMDELCGRIQREFQDTGRVLVVNEMWGCWTTDIIIEYCFERRYNFIREPDFKSGFVASLIDLLEGVHWITQFPWMVKAMQFLPDSLVGWLDPRMRNVIKFNEEMLTQVKEALDSAHNNDVKGQRPDTIFTSIIQSDIPRSEVTPSRLQHEAISVVGAGIETTMRTLTISVFHIVNNPSIHQQLREELTTAIHDPDNMPSWEVLEQLPFLSACINESLRLAYGTSQRIPRIADNKAIQYREYVIPPGTVISMDIYGVSHDESVFPDSHSYNPSRWLDNPRAADGRLLSRYMVAFGRGPRSCVGLQLAYAELFIGIATLFRRFNFELYETDQTDADLARDRFVPRPKASSKGIRVLVK